MKTGSTDARGVGSHLVAMPTGASYRFGQFFLDGPRRRLYQDGRLVALPAKAVETLLILIEHQGRLVEKDELMRTVWPHTFVGDGSLAQCISVLRHALGDSASEPRYIVTVPREGYRFIAAVTESSRPDGANPVSPLQAIDQGRRRGKWLIGIVAVLVGAAVDTGSVFVRGSSQPAPIPLRFREYLPPGVAFSGGVAVSPDGRSLVYVAKDASGHNQLWLRRLDGMTAHALAGTVDAVSPFWSPDGTAIGFFADRWVKILRLSSGTVQPLVKVLLIPTGGTWSREGQIIYGTRTGALNVISADGGSTKPATTLDQHAKEYGHLRPQFLPDGRHFLYSVLSTNEAIRGLYVTSLDSREKRRLLDGTYGAVTYSPTGHLLFVKNQMVMAQRFDQASFTLVGSPRRLTEALPWPAEAITISASQRLLAISGGAGSDHLRWVDRSGRPLGPVETSAPLHTPMLSPDGTRLVASSDAPDMSGVWLVDLRRGAASRVVSDGIVPYWSPTGDHIAYSSTRRAGVLDIYLWSGASPTRDTLLLQNNQSKGVTDWSADGRLVVNMANQQDNIDIWLVDALTGRSEPWLQTPANELQGRVSPDGRWLAYTSDETGRWQVYVQSFPHPGMKRAVSILGGAQPAWRGDGKELYFLTPETVLTAVAVSSAGELGPPRPLFRAPVSSDLVRRRNTYAVTADGQRFLIDAIDDGDRVIDTIVDWEMR